MSRLDTAKLELRNRRKFTIGYLLFHSLIAKPTRAAHDHDCEERDQGRAKPIFALALVKYHLQCSKARANQYKAAKSMG